MVKSNQVAHKGPSPRKNKSPKTKSRREERDDSALSKEEDSQVQS